VSKRKRTKRSRARTDEKSALQRAFPTLSERGDRFKEAARRWVPTVQENGIAIGMAGLLFVRPFICGKTYEWSNGVFQILICALFAMWISRACRQKRLTFRAPLLTACLGIFVMVSGATILVSVNSDETYRRFFELLSYFLLFVMAASAVRGTRSVTGIVIAVTVASVLVCGYGFYQGLFGLEEARAALEQNKERVFYRITGDLSPQFMERLSWNRIFSYFLHPNSFAGYLVLLIPVSICSFIATIITSRRRSSQGDAQKRSSPLPAAYEELPPFSVVAWFIVALVQIGALIWTFSRGAWLSLLVSIVCLDIFVLSRGRRWWRNAVVASCLCVLVLTASHVAKGQGQAVTPPTTVAAPGPPSPGSPETIRGQIPTVSKLASQETWQARMTYWQGALGMIRARPWLGVGLSAFGSAYPRFMVVGGYPVQEAHNDPLQVLAETGVAGFVPFAAFWLILLWSGFRSCSARSSTSARWLKLGLMFGIIAFLLHGLVDFDFQIPGIALNVFAFCGLLVAASEGSDRHVRFGWEIGVPLFAALAAAIALLLRPHVADALFNGTGFVLPQILAAWWHLSAQWVCYAIIAAIVFGACAKLMSTHKKKAAETARTAFLVMAFVGAISAVLLTFIAAFYLWRLTRYMEEYHGFGTLYRANQLEAVQKIMRGDTVPDLLLATLFPKASDRDRVRNAQESRADAVAMTRPALRKAKEELIVATNIYPRQAIYYIYLAEMDVLLSRFEPEPVRSLDRALASFEKAIELNPWNHSWHRFLGEAYFERSAHSDKRYYLHKALEEFKRVVENYPTDPDGWMRLGTALLYDEQPDRAGDCFRRARELREQARR